MVPSGDTSYLQTPNPTLLLWSKGTWGQEPRVAVLGQQLTKAEVWETTIRLNSGNLVEELAKGLEECSGIATPLEEQHRLT